MLLKVANDIGKPTDIMAKDLHSKYFALNNSFMENKGPKKQIINPITHEVTFSGKDLISGFRNGNQIVT